MPETPRTEPSGREVYQIERDRFGLSYSGPYVKVGEYVEVVPLALVDAERERMLDLLEDVLPHTDMEIANRIEATLFQHDRLQGGEDA